jgi:hypothetical protein
MDIALLPEKPGEIPDPGGPGQGSRIKKAHREEKNDNTPARVKRGFKTMWILLNKSIIRYLQYLLISLLLCWIKI